jgi:hypothetical protein
MLRSGVLALIRRGDDVVRRQRPLRQRQSEGGTYAYAAVTDLQAVYGGPGERRQ